MSRVSSVPNCEVDGGGGGGGEVKVLSAHPQKRMRKLMIRLAGVMGKIIS
jgi:hypothetical protein